MGRSGDQVVSVLDFYYNNPSSNPFLLYKNWLMQRKQKTKVSENWTPCNSS